MKEVKKMKKFIKVLLTIVLSFSVLWFLPYHQAEAATKTMYVTASVLNVRQSPDTQSKVVTTVKKDVAVSVSQTRGSWSQVNVNNKIGWVSSQYLTSQKPETSKVMYVTANATLNSSASSKGKTLATLTAGATITKYSTSSGDYWKATSSSKTGWILKSKVSDTKTVMETTTSAIVFKTVKQNDSTLPKGETKVFQNGKNGVTTKVSQTTYKNGKLISTKLVSSKVTTNPIDQIIKVGTKTGTLYLSAIQAKSVLNGTKIFKKSVNGAEFYWVDEAGLQAIRVIVGNEHVKYIDWDSTPYAARNVSKAELISILGKNEGTKTYEYGQNIRRQIESMVRAAANSVYGSGTAKANSLYSQIIGSGDHTFSF
jgi:SH3-like domain-containing protein